MVAICVCQSVVGNRQPELSIPGETAVDEHILVFDFSDGRSLEETEHLILFVSRNHVFHNFCARLYGCHRFRVKLGCIGTFEAPVAIHTTVIIHKHGRVELQHTICLERILLVPVAHLEGTVGAVALCHHAIASPFLIVRVEIIRLRAVCILHHRHVGCIQYIRLPFGIDGFAFPVLVHTQDFAVISPAVEAIDRCRPHHLLTSAVASNHAVVRAVDIDTVLSGLVGVFKHIGLSIGDMLPQRQVGVAHRWGFFFCHFRCFCGAGGHGCHTANRPDEKPRKAPFHCKMFHVTCDLGFISCCKDNEKTINESLKHESLYQMGCKIMNY